MAGGRGKILDFNQRLEIAIDIAHGLTYLHLYAGMLLSIASYSLFLVSNGLSVLETPLRDQYTKMKKREKIKSPLEF